MICVPDKVVTDASKHTRAKINQKTRVQSVPSKGFENPPQPRSPPLQSGLPRAMPGAPGLGIPYLFNSSKHRHVLSGIPQSQLAPIAVLCETPSKTSYPPT
jgi:hypothetical protein